ncbi:MAG: hypothetical protein KY428_09110 [Bacteroidetes bacterium]|nr:hypothetical protein [Bacteroidota bacterium]
MIELNTETLELNKRIIPKSISIHGYDYALLESSMKVIAINNNAVATFEYILPVEAKDNVPLTLYYYFSDRLVNSNVSHYNKIIPNGSVAGPFFGANSDQMLLHGKPDTKELLIPSFIEEDSTFFLDLPEDVILTDKYSAQVKINNDRILLMNFYNQNNSNPNYYLYNKHLSIWGKFPQNESYTNIINYGDWLAGASNIEIGQRPYEGKQVGEDRWIESDSKYGYSIRKYMNRKMPRTKLSGFLFIRNILDLTTVLYWNTGQSDSEILLIDSNLVYYRKHDEIWEVPIINNHELGKHRLLIKHPDVTSIHFMFLK